MFQALTLVNDIAVVKTLDEIIFSSIVRQIPLNNQHVGTSWTVSAYGWGFLSEGGSLSASLTSTLFMTLDHATCLSRFPFVTRRFITDQHICIFFSARATCPG